LPIYFIDPKEKQIIMTGQEISVNIPPTLDPVYSNMIQIAYKDDEFTFMFLPSSQVTEHVQGDYPITRPMRKSSRRIDKDGRRLRIEIQYISPSKEAHGSKVTT
jgi:hypothetical protein